MRGKKEIGKVVDQVGGRDFERFVVIEWRVGAVFALIREL